MKSLDKRWLLFLVLILVLATGLPYLSLNQEASTTSEVNSEDVQSMSIALVNEDEGAVFNGSELTFGEAFVRSLDSNDEHNWFVVSRGVAESGLDRNTYDMMIVIPNDFSEKALSIDSESPEQVVLNYQINASDDEYIRAEAERTASTILNEFNRRIIDVYFASIIGNLQDAQDNIGEIVDKQTQHTSTYNNDINNPLSNYTNQFGLIKDNTQASRDSFGGLEDLMEGFEDRLAEGADQSQNYLSGLDDFTSTKEGNVNELLSFSDALLQFDQRLNNQDAEQNLVKLQQMNELINYQFQVSDLGDDKNIVTETRALKNHLTSSLDRIETAQEMVELRLQGLEEEVEDVLSREFEEALNGDSEPLKELFASQDDEFNEQIKEQIRNLPSLEKGDFRGVDLPRETVREILNVITVVDRYEEEFESVPSWNNDETLKDKITRLKQHLQTSGVTFNDTVWIPENEKEGQEFKLQIPEGYELARLELYMPGQWWKDYTDDFINSEDNKLNLEANEEGEFALRVHLTLSEDSNLDVFDPINLSWELEHKYIKEEDIDEGSEYRTEVPNSVLVASTSAESDNKTTKSSGDGNDIEESNEENTDGTSEDNDLQEDEDFSDNENGNESDENTGEENSEGTDSGKGDGNEDITDVNEDPDEDNGNGDDETEIKKLTIFNNRISHELTKSLAEIDELEIDNATESLIRAVINTVTPYQKLYSTFESYFGLEMDERPRRFKRMLDRHTLKGAASESSLYYLFNEQNVNDLIKDYMVKQIKDGVHEEINTPLTALKNNIETYKSQVGLADQRADTLIEKIRTTREAAQIQNENLGQLLEQVANWREQSMNLLDQHGVVQENDMGEQQAIMTLNNEFQPLLSESQSIAEQAQGNLSSAESVYQTLDTIDGQADNIEQSGADLVTQADQLSTEMTEKMFEDQEFAENFSNVLANSRVGERQNENLYNFLSNPVQTSNQGTITSGDNFTPYFLVLTIFIVVLFTAYVISTLHQKRTEEDQFAHQKSLMGANTPITIITAGIGALEGIAIGVISSYLLQIGEGSMVLWTILITALIIGMLLVATYLLRQVKMIGMFVLLIVMSMYLFLTNAFGTGIAGLDYLRAYSPLQYVESLLLQAVQGNANYLLAMLVIAGIIVIGALANLFVLTREEKGDLENEGSEEAS